MRKPWMAWCAAWVWLVGGSGGAMAWEQRAAVPEASPATSQPGVITRDDLAMAVERYIQREAEIQNGFFLLYDKTSNQAVALQLQGIEKERIERLDEARYVAVARMKDQQGQEMLLDIFMRYLGNDQLKVTEVSKHNDEIQPEYRWDETQKNWQKK